MFDNNYNIKIRLQGLWFFSLKMRAKANYIQKRVKSFRQYFVSSLHYLHKQ